MPASAISVGGLSKRYRLYRRRHQSIKEIVARRSLGEWDDLWALRDVSFDVPRGQFLGVVGHNGSGKSTLLKVLTGILRPDAGSVAIEGRVSSLLELAAGFQPEYTGHENVYLYGALLGLRKHEVRRHYDSIVEFAELHDFIDHPVKNYSSGMYVRLGFAVAVHLDPEVLLIDEVLAVGDASFQQKCFDHLHRLRARGCTIVLVSHDTASVSRFCERAIWLDHGRVLADGASDGVVRRYAEAVAAGASLSQPAAVEPPRPEDPAEIVIDRIRLLDAAHEETARVRSRGPLRIEAAYRAARTLECVELTLAIHRDDGVRCVDAPLRAERLPQRGTLVLEFPAFDLQAGRYDLSILLSDPDRGRPRELVGRAHPFTVEAERASGGVVWLDHRWEVRPAAPAATSPGRD
ncbi:MAG TPA: ABC transporter ATP-binding protein [Candidatus Dormibacteraeota bacterium]|nr:ABC transporter ATP-binding protein [Candidatus Dormibacteraeota bacterium]